ncbi:MAG: PIG-L family deacetylase [Bacteroidia bacterium]|nr:PIG-L family deacetylase [Bacteroidia bacterium]
MARFLYIFPHPDDESFGPAAGMHAQLREGHEVFLLTLTRGGATKMRFSLNKTVEEMGLIRLKELEAVRDYLQLTGLTVLDLEDGGLREMDPRELEWIIREQIEQIQPNIVVTYPVHGISGHHDHLVCHAVVKRLYVELLEIHTYLQRLAFFTLPDLEETPTQGGMVRVNRSRKAFIDCVLTLTPANEKALVDCLNCYPTYRQVIEETGVAHKAWETLHFELFGEDYKPPITSLTENLPR